MRRREFITLLGGAAASLPLTARAQQSSEMRRIAVLASGNADDQGLKSALAAFQQRLQQLGWTDGQNLRIELRRGEGDEEKIRKYSGELAALAPDVILALGSSSGTIVAGDPRRADRVCVRPRPGWLRLRQ